MATRTRLRTGPQGLPAYVPVERDSIYLHGTYGTRIRSSQGFLSKFLFMAYIKPDSALNGVRREILSRTIANAPNTTDFPFSFLINTSNQLQLQLDSGNDFSVDLTVALTTRTVPNDKFSFIACGVVSGASGLYHIQQDNDIVSASHTVSLAAGNNFTLGNTFQDQTINGFPYGGYMSRPVLYNWDGNNIQALIGLYRAGIRWTPGLVVEWQPPVRIT